MNAQQSNIKLVVAGLPLGIFMAAIDNTIVATALSTIIRDLQGFDQVVWVTSIYMVAVMAGTPIFGKLSDMYGRKRFFIFGLVVFLIGSALCGMANNMTELIIYRAIQGIGGGALMPIAFTIVFDLFPPEKRGKMTEFARCRIWHLQRYGTAAGRFYYRQHRLGMDILCQRADRYRILYLHHDFLQGVPFPCQTKIDWTGRNACRRDHLPDVRSGTGQANLCMGFTANSGLVRDSLLCLLCFYWQRPGD